MPRHLETHQTHRIANASAARAGGSQNTRSIAKSAARMLMWGVIAMVCSALVGRLFGVALG